MGRELLTGRLEKELIGHVKWTDLQRFWKVRWESMSLRTWLGPLCGIHWRCVRGVCIYILLAQLGCWGSTEDPLFARCVLVCWHRKQWKLKVKPCHNFSACKETSCNWMSVPPLLGFFFLVSCCLTSAVLQLVRPNKIILWDCNFTLSPRTERLTWSAHHLLGCTTADSLIW